MKYIFALVAVITSILVIKSCGLGSMLYYSHLIKPIETPYFSRGLIKKSSIPSTEMDTIKNLLSENAILLQRKNDEDMEPYWVDFDSIKGQESLVKLKIIDLNGKVIRYLDTWLEPELKNGKNAKLIEGKSGNLVLKTSVGEHRFFHAGDMMGKHHFDIVMPQSLNGNASFQMNWDGYGYNYSWISYGGIREHFYLLNQYDVNGLKTDSFYLLSNQVEEKVISKGFIQYKKWSEDCELKLEYNSEVFCLKIFNNPFNGFGVDKVIQLVHPVLHSIEANGYIKNCLLKINFGESISEFDWIRDSLTLVSVNETMKAIGYSNFVSESEFTEEKYWIRDDYLVNHNGGYSLKTIMDSLIICYNSNVGQKYYKDFWARRKSENIAPLVFEIIKEIRAYYQNEKITIQANLVNDTLKKLVEFDLQIQADTNFKNQEILDDYFNYLTEIGMNQSAYNLIHLSKLSEYFNPDLQNLENKFEVLSKVYWIDNKPYVLTDKSPQWIVSN